MSHTGLRSTSAVFVGAAVVGAAGFSVDGCSRGADREMPNVESRVSGGALSSGDASAAVGFSSGVIDVVITVMPASTTSAAAAGATTFRARALAGTAFLWRAEATSRSPWGEAEVGFRTSSQAHLPLGTRVERSPARDG